MVSDGSRPQGPASPLRRLQRLPRVGPQHAPSSERAHQSADGSVAVGRPSLRQRTRRKDRSGRRPHLQRLALSWKTVQSSARRTAPDTVLASSRRTPDIEARSLAPARKRTKERREAEPKGNKSPYFDDGVVRQRRRNRHGPSERTRGVSSRLLLRTPLQWALGSCEKKESTSGRKTPATSMPSLAASTRPTGRGSRGFLKGSAGARSLTSSPSSRGSGVGRGWRFVVEGEEIPFEPYGYAMFEEYVTLLEDGSWSELR